MNTEWIDLGIVILTLIAAGVYLYARSNKQAQLLERLKTEIERKNDINLLTSSNSRKTQIKKTGLGVLRRIGSAVPLFSAAQRLEINQKLVMAGWRSPQALLIVAALSALSAGTSALATIVFIWPKFDDLLAIKMGSLLLGFGVCQQ